VRSPSPTAGADYRFARSAGDVGTCEINGKHKPEAWFGLLAVRLVGGRPAGRMVE